MMGIKEIQEIIPHRHPFLLIDCIEEVTPGEGAVGYKNVTYNEPWFAGHFPQATRSCPPCSGWRRWRRSARLRF